MKPRFQSIEMLPDDPVLGLPKLFNQDVRQEKVNLGVGIYHTEEGNSLLLKSVQAAEERVVLKKNPKDYLPIEGDPYFLKKIAELVLGQTLDKESVLAVQTIGGTGALRLAADVFSIFVCQDIALTDPSWPNHQGLFAHAGFHIHFLPFYDAKNHRICFHEMIEAVKKLPDGTIILLQPACHNPTGADFSKEQWEAILSLVEKKHLFPLFDSAYQGFGRSLEEDVYPLRLFYARGLDFAVTVSLAKNFGLYGERVGALLLVLRNYPEKTALMSQIRKIIRSHYSSPPLHGVKIVNEIFQSPELFAIWRKELQEMQKRIGHLRKAFGDALKQASGKPWPSFSREKGFFSLLGISEEKVLRLRHEKGIYTLLNGRINMTGLNSSNISYVIDSLLEIGL